MWIVPKTLSHFVPATAGWSWALDEQAWMFAQSVTWRSKFMSKQYWLKRWKKGDYVQHLSGLTLNPSMHDRFVESWTESQEASHVSHFQVQESEKDKKTQGTYGQASQTLFEFADLDGSSSKTCQDWLPLGCVTSCKTWDKWVTERRGAYSQRKKLALHTKGNESSSLRGWATPQASDHVEGARTAKESNQKCLGRDLNQMNWPTPRAGNPGSRKPGTGGKILAEEAKKNWATPQSRDHKTAETKGKWEARAKLQAEKGVNLHLPLNTQCQHIMEEQHNGLPAPEKNNTSGKNHGSWPTARSSDAEGGRIKTEKTEKGFRSKREKSDQYFGAKLRDAAEMEKPPTMKLNPNWVEQLMGLSTGWTDLGSWGME